MISVNIGYNNNIRIVIQKTFSVFTSFYNYPFTITINIISLFPIMFN